MILRKRLGWWLRCWADRIDPDNAPRAMSYAFTFERGVGIVIRRGTSVGCPLWYMGKDQFERAHTEAMRP